MSSNSPALILIAGLPGTGKTSFAKYLSRKLGIPMVSKDIIKEHLFDTIGFKNRAEKVTLGIAAADLMYHVAELHLEIGLPIILENNFESASKPGLLKLIAHYNCKTVMVKFHTEPGVLGKRFLERDKSPERHRGHVINTRYPEVPDNGKLPPDQIQGDRAPSNQDSYEPQVTDFSKYYNAMIQRGMADFSVDGEEIFVDTTDFAAVSYDSICNKVKLNISPGATS